MQIQHTHMLMNHPIPIILYPCAEVQQPPSETAEETGVGVMGSSPSSRQVIDCSPLREQTQPPKSVHTLAATSGQLSNLGCVPGLTGCRGLTPHPLTPATAPLQGVAATPWAPAPQSSHVCVGETLLCEDTWKPRRDGGNSHKLRVLLQTSP